MITSGQLKTITDIRNSPGNLLDQIKKDFQPIGILRRNRLEAYLIDAKTFENLEQLAEDVIDRQIVAERLHAASRTDFIAYRQ